MGQTRVGTVLDLAYYELVMKVCVEIKERRASPTSSPGDQWLSVISGC